MLKFSQDNPQNNFLNFLTSKIIFITLQYSGNILGIFWKHYFVITGICRKINICYHQIIHFNTKTTFPSRTF